MRLIVLEEFLPQTTLKNGFTVRRYRFAGILVNFQFLARFLGIGAGILSPSGTLALAHLQRHP